VGKFADAVIGRSASIAAKFAFNGRGSAFSAAGGSPSGSAAIAWVIER
jgi:hypothetical protein